MALNTLAGAAGVLQIAGNFSGIPYASAAATVLSGIIATSQQLVVHRRKCKSLADKANLLVATLQDQASKLEGTELQQTVDEVIHVLERVHKKTRKYGRYNRVKSFLKMNEVENGLDKCLSDLDTAMNIFSVNANITIHHAQRETQELVRSNTAATTDLLYQILTSQEEMRRVIEMQANGGHVAEQIMEAGQVQLRRLRESPSKQQQPQRVASPDRMLLSSSPLSQTPEPEESKHYLEYQRGLFELHQKTGVPPTVKSLNGEVKKVGDLAVTGGTYSDVWVGLWLGQEKVALKALRNIKAGDAKAQKRFEHEIGVWSKLQHKNVLAFYGIVTDLGQIHMVSPWQEHGNVLEFVDQNPEANRLRLLSGAAEGLEYLHGSKIVHGNLKCANILVASDGNARICDFGMSTVIEEITEKAASATLTAAGSARWLAPELIEGTITSPTFPADTYSFAMAILELLTGKHPYAHRKRDASVIHDIVVLKKMPPRPLIQHLTDDLWVLMQECWSPNADSRPLMGVVASRMMKIESSLSADGSEPMDTT
jgi:hypothetical protein